MIYIQNNMENMVAAAQKFVWVITKWNNTDFLFL